MPTRSVTFKDDLLAELELLRNGFISNGYPTRFVDRTANNSWKVELKKQVYTSLSEKGILDHEEEEENPGYYNTLIMNAPYIAGFSERLTKDLKGIDVGVTFSKG